MSKIGISGSSLVGITTDGITEGSTNKYISSIMYAGLVQGRGTLESGVAVSTTDQTAKTTVHWTPFKGNKVGLYTGTGSIWELLTFTEKSLAVPATTNTNYDVFAYNNSGTLALEAVAWTNDTTRATALVLQDGVEVKSGDTTKLYVFSFRTGGTSGQTEDSLLKRFMWNRYNKELRKGQLSDATGHAYTTAVSRAWNNDTAIKFEFIQGLAQVVNLNYTAIQSGDWATYSGICLDGANLATTVCSITTGTGATYTGQSSTRSHQVVAGYHYWGAAEIGAANAYFSSFVAELVLWG